MISRELVAVLMHLELQMILHLEVPLFLVTNHVQFVAQYCCQKSPLVGDCGVGQGVILELAFAMLKPKVEVVM